MTEEEFGRCFGEILILRYHEGYHYQAEKVRHVPGAHSILKFDVKEDTTAYFEVTQLDAGFYRGNCEYEYSQTRLILAKKIENGGLEYCYGIRSQ